MSHLTVLLGSMCNHSSNVDLTCVGGLMISPLSICSFVVLLPVSTYHLQPILTKAPWSSESLEERQEPQFNAFADTCLVSSRLV